MSNQFLSRAFEGGVKKLPPGASSLKKLYRNYKNHALTRDRDFALTLKEFEELTSSNCAYCGLEPSQVQQERGCNGPYIYNGVDRVNNTVGYVFSNCVPCCKTCNHSKGNKPLAEWNAWLDRILQFRSCL